MSNLTCSLAIKRGVVSVLIIEGGMMQTCAVEKIKDKKALESSYAGIIYAFTIALRHLRDYIQNNVKDYNVCFETSNSTFIKWVDNQYSKVAYQDEFIAALKLLQELPIRYAFHYCEKPKAVAYANESYCKKEKLSGLDID